MHVKSRKHVCNKLNAGAWMCVKLQKHADRLHVAGQISLTPDVIGAKIGTVAE